ncbi:MAG: EamA family transporter [Planctomycetota bacterium]|jgi:multidrug transporter EmrE-like cation transporter
MGYVCILLTIVFSVYGQLIIKQQVNSVASFPSGLNVIPFVIKFILTRPLVLSGFLTAFLGSITWIKALSKFELSYAYPFMSLNFVLVVLLSFWVFKEEVNLHKVFGLILICMGVFIVSKGS